MPWHPRGTPTWPDWKKAASGTRVEHVQTGRTGTFIKPSKTKNNGAIIEWDGISGISAGRVRRAYVVAPAFDLRPVKDEHGRD